MTTKLLLLMIACRNRISLVESWRPFGVNSRGIPTQEVQAAGPAAPRRGQEMIRSQNQTKRTSRRLQRAVKSFRASKCPAPCGVMLRSAACSDAGLSPSATVGWSFEMVAQEAASVWERQMGLAKGLQDIWSL
jgi:hypothetical protein